MSLRGSILHHLIPFNAFQPATVLWRVHEIAALVQHADLSGRLIDVGCGDGTVARVLFDHVPVRPVAVGAEPDPRDAALASRSGAYARVHVAAGDAIPETAASFDVALSNSTLEHIEPLPPVVAELARLVRAGGRLVITVPSEEFHDCLAGSALIAVLARRRGRTYRDALDERLAHRRYLGPEGWRALLGAHGFADLRFHRYLPAAAVRAWERLSNATGGLAYELTAARRGTRSLQRSLSLVRRVPVAERLVAAALARTAALEADVDGAPSGGLLILATRA